MDDISPSFALEYQLRDFLAANIGTIPVNGHRLRLFVDATGRDGVEFPTAVGPIDILATDDNGALFVFELSAPTVPIEQSGSSRATWDGSGKPSEKSATFMACSSPDRLAKISGMR
jgi:hypothetical protein